MHGTKLAFGDFYTEGRSLQTFEIAPLNGPKRNTTDRSPKGGYEQVQRGAAEGREQPGRCLEEESGNHGVREQEGGDVEEAGRRAQHC